MVGVQGPLPDLEDEDQPRWQPLPFAQSYAKQLRAAFRFFGYRPHITEADPAGSAAALEQAVESVLEAGPGFVVVHILAHGKLADSGGVYVVGGDERPTRHDIESWLKLVEDTEPEESAPHVLFLLDLCYSGSAARREWQHTMPGHRRRAWVIAASGIGEQAYDGHLSRAVAEVLGRFANESVRVDPSVPYIPFHLFCRQVKDLVKEYTADGPPQEVLDPLVPASDAELSHLTFFPNPAYGRDGSRAVARDRMDRTVTALLDEVADVRHFVGRASGAEAVFGEGGPVFFRGRDAEVRSLSDWLRGKGRDLRVVTGKPGAGKSALLGALVCVAHPDLRGESHGLWKSLVGGPPVVDELAVVHARKRSVSEVMAALGRQWKLGSTRSVSDVVSALQGRDRPPVLILDALDEAEDPQELMKALLALSRVCRMLVGVRPGRFAPLFRRAGRGRIDLDRVRKQRLRGELRDYLRDVLATDSHYATVEGEGIADQLADGIARALARRGAPECGEFLVAALYVRRVLDQPVPDDPAGVRRLVTAVPRDLHKVMDLHRDDHQHILWMDPVLSALAFAQGDGMPEEVVRTTAAAFGPGKPRIEQVREALDAARFYLRHGVDDEGRTVYRLFHQGLADKLRSEKPDADAVFTQLLTFVPDSRRWATAEPYLLRHAAQHAADAGRLEELLDDPEFVLHADAEALERQLRLLDGARWRPKWARRDRLPPLARLYVDTADAHRYRTPSQRRQILTIAAAQRGEQELASALASGGSWRAHRVGRVPEHRLLQEIPWDSSTQPPVWVERRSRITSLVPVSLGGGSNVITASQDGKVRVWDLRERKVLGSGAPLFDVDKGKSMVACTVLDSVILATYWFDEMGGNSSRVNVWELPDARFVKQSVNVSRQLFVAVAGATVRDRPVAVLCGYRRRPLSFDAGLLVLWDLREDRRLGEPLLDQGAPLGCVAVVSVGGRPHAVTGGGDGTVRVWDLEAGQEVRVLAGHKGGVRCVAAASVEGRPYAVTGGGDGTVRVWDLEAGQEVRVLAGHKGGVRCVVVASVGGRPHTLTGGEDDTVRISDMLTGAEEDVLCLPEGLRALAVATDGMVVAALADMLIALEPGSGLPPFLPWSPVTCA
ncbi:hypothetical protein StrepF001_28320 [Streptomyces sp. F001]|nr:hypothetical protein StrepF001_28320 [Streptomyces sp. F001]